MERSEQKENYYSLAVVILFMLTVRAYIGLNHEVFRSIQQAKALDWIFILLWSALGTLGLFVYSKCDFPSAWSKSISHLDRLVYPAIIGVLFGILSIFNDQFTHWTNYVADKMGIESIHIDFPYSILIYPAGAAVHEIFNRILLVSLLTWIFGVLMFKGKCINKVFWRVAVVTSLIEPLGDLGLWKFSPIAMVTSFTIDFAFNLMLAYYMRKAGFLASITMRVFFYLIWHVGYGLYFQ